MLERRTSSGITSAGDPGASPDSMLSSSRRRLLRPISAKSWRIVVSGGV